MNSVYICEGIAILGVPVTAVLASRAGSKAAQIDIAGLSKWEAFKKRLPCYIPAILAGCVTTGAIAMTSKMANDAARDKLVAYASSVAALDSHMGKTLPPRIEQKKEPDISRWHEPITDQWFDASPYDIRNAAYELNKQMILNGAVTHGDFCRLLQIRPDKHSELVGWSDISAIEYEYTWIDVDWRPHMDANQQLYFELYYPHPPHDDYKDPGGWISEKWVLRKEIL